MSSKIENLLKKQGWILADGATGTNLFNMGLEAGEAPEIWNFEQPDNIKKLYKGAVDAGSDLFLTNSFGANASRLKLHNMQDKVFEVNKRAVELAQDVVAAAGREIVIAGSVGPSGEIMGPSGTLSHETAVEIFEEQIQGLVAGGVDVIWAETISAQEEFSAIAEAVGRVGVPWGGTMSFDTAGRTMMGITSAAFADYVSNLDNRPVAYGANCGVGASDLLRTVDGFSKSQSTLPIIAKGNAGIPKFVNGHIHYDGTPELMARYATTALDLGASIIGGCCGTMPEHLRKMREALENHQSSERPTFDEIQHEFGAFSSASDGTDDQAQTRTRRRARRRA